MLGHDPLPGPLLTLDADDYLVACAVLERAAHLRRDEQTAMLRGHAELTAAHTARRLGRMLARALSG